MTGNEKANIMEPQKCLLIQYILLVVLKCSEVYSGPIVQTPLGEIEGVVQTSRKGRQYDAYRGIPYGKPPVGALRFQNPVPVQPWNGTWNATVNGPFCAQKNFLFSNFAIITGQEDCLYLNVYVPRNVNNKLLPVMVFIHGGGFITGQATSSAAGPELGVLGMLSTLDDNAPGNLNLKDQILVLKWVRDNIKAFGGNSKKVTIFGESSGAASVHLHMLSPSSKGLFKRAIMQSGSALQYYVIPHNEIQKNVTEIQAQLVGCQDSLSNSLELIKCLQEVDVNDLLNSVDNFKVYNDEPFYIYTLIVETASDLNPDPFLTESPLEILKRGDYQTVPVITGVMQNEGLFTGAPYIRNPKIMEGFNEAFDQIFPVVTNLNFSTSNVSGLWNNITEFYLNGTHYIDPNNTDNLQGVIDIIGDRRVTYAVYQNIRLLLAKSNSPVWVYNIAYRGQYSFADARANSQDNCSNYTFGASHADDLIYLFTSPALLPQLEQANDIQLSEFLIDCWTSFAIYGDPNTQRSYNWAPSNPAYAEIHYLNITGSVEEALHFEIEDDFFYDRMQFWTNQDIIENIDIYSKESKEGYLKTEVREKY